MYLNELERDRNQYSRDTREAWQDFISLKSRMDTELGNVNRQNDILFKELESWGQQVRLLFLVLGCNTNSF